MNYRQPYEVIFYANTFENSLMNYYYQFEYDTFSPNQYESGTNSYAIATHWNKYTQQCVEDCEELDGNWVNPTSLIGDDGFYLTYTECQC